jgi:hypothetical protein
MAAVTAAAATATADTAAAATAAAATEAAATAAAVREPTLTRSRTGRSQKSVWNWRSPGQMLTILRNTYERLFNAMDQLCIGVRLARAACARDTGLG